MILPYFVFAVPPPHLRPGEHNARDGVAHKAQAAYSDEEDAGHQKVKEEACVILIFHLFPAAAAAVELVVGRVDVSGEHCTVTAHHSRVRRQHAARGSSLFQGHILAAAVQSVFLSLSCLAVVTKKVYP